MFFDEVILEIHGGRGGNGMVSFHREKFVAFGPPDGGDGGNGGNVYLNVNSNLNTLKHFAGRKKFKADPGKGGHKNNRHGKSGEHLEIEVPKGTLVYNADSGELICDLKEENTRMLIAKGGRGGYGNGHFGTSTRQAPKFAELGDIGGEMRIRLELQLVADVGLLGFPSAGKSTLISHLSSSKAKIGDYPFTTIVPNLGVVFLSQFGAAVTQNFVIADMPGIIEGASEGKGLGHQFLRHISRTALLVYILDPFSDEEMDIVKQYEILKSELEKYDDRLLGKAHTVAINKIDAIPKEDREELKKSLLKSYPELKEHLYFISAASGEGLEPFAFDLYNEIEADKRKHEALEDEQEQAEELQTYVPEFFVEDKHFTVEKAYEVDVSDFDPRINGMLISPESKQMRDLFVVKGNRIEQISRMTNVDQKGAIMRVYDVLNKMDIQNALRREGAVSGDLIKIGPHFYEYHDL